MNANKLMLGALLLALSCVATASDAARAATKSAPSKTAKKPAVSSQKLVFSARDFGAKPDGSDASLAVRKAFARHPGATVFLPAGTYTFRTPLRVPKGSALVGEESKTTIKRVGNFNLFTFGGSDCVVKNLLIQSGGNASGWDFLLDCSKNVIERITIENITTFGGTGFLTDSGPKSKGFHVTLRVNSCQARGHRGAGVKLARAYAFQFFNEVTIDYVGVRASNYTGFEFDGTSLRSVAAAGGVIMRDCDVLGTAGTRGVANLPQQNGFIFRESAAIYLSHTRADTLGGTGYLFEKCNIVSLIDIEVGLCDGHSLVFRDTSYVRGSNLNVRGRAFPMLSYAASPARDGLRFEGTCTRINLGQVTIFEQTGNGLHRAGQTELVLFSGLASHDNTGRGVQTEGSGSLLVNGGTLGLNAGGDYALSDARDALRDVMTMSGKALDVSGPAKD